jgi:hypothetical protein
MGGNVKSQSNKRNGLVARVCGEFLFIVIKLIERKRESGFFTLTMLRELHMRRASFFHSLSKITLTFSH